MTLIQAIEAAGIADELRAFATPDVLNPELEAWLRRHEKLRGLPISWPVLLRYMRKHFGVSCGRGGVRPRGPKFYDVKMRKNRSEGVRAAV